MPDDGDNGIVDPVPPGVRRDEDFDTSYRTGTPPLDIGRPRPRSCAARGRRDPGHVLDVGCGPVTRP